MGFGLIEKRNNRRRRSGGLRRHIVLQAGGIAYPRIGGMDAGGRAARERLPSMPRKGV